MDTPRPLGTAFQDALGWVVELHCEQARKGSDTPYVAHLLAVASIVLEHGGDEQQAIAALLHDAIEDCEPIQPTDIRERFGERVARMVEDCTDAYRSPKPPWRERKERYLRHLENEAHDDSVLISMADKFHNASSIVRDYHRTGGAVFDLFQPEPGETAWYYESLVRAYEKRAPTGAAARLLEDLRRQVSELRRLAARAARREPGEEGRPRRR